jgi:GT2 family glycosyltransferase
MKTSDQQRPISLPTVLIVVINWNGKRDLQDCLSSIEKLQYPKEQYKILVIDNGSVDGSRAAVETSFPHVEFVTNLRNIGYVRAVNQGIRHGLQHGFNYIWIFNNDVVIDGGALELLVREGECDDRIGVLGPVVYSFNRPEEAPHVGYKIDFWTGQLKRLRYGLDVFREMDSRCQDVDSMIGCSNLIKASVFKRIGLMRALYELYFEETDFNVRAARAGFRVVVVRDARVRHKDAATMNRHLFRRAYLLLRNLLVFEILNARIPQLLVFIPYYLIVHIPYFLVRGTIYGLSVKRAMSNENAD